MSALFQNNQFKIIHKPKGYILGWHLLLTLQLINILKSLLINFPSEEWHHICRLLIYNQVFLFFFLMWTILKAFIENLLQYCFCFIFGFFGHEICGILAPQTGIEPALSSLECNVLTSGSPGKSPKFS